MTWQGSVSSVAGRTTCPSTSGLIVELPRKNTKSPIDIFYNDISVFLSTFNPDFVSANGSQISNLALVGIISATENYFRNVLGSIISVCPKAQAGVTEEKIQIGSMLWSDDWLKNGAAFEFVPFSSGDGVKKVVEKFVGFSIKKGGDFELMISEYDKICELRHAIVHSLGFVSGKNAIRLGVARTNKRVVVSFDYSAIQSAGLVCTALVVAANNELFEALVKRWAVDWRAYPLWDPSKEKSYLKAIRDIFLSRRDMGYKSVPNALTLGQLYAQAKTFFGL